MMTRPLPGALLLAWTTWAAAPLAAQDAPAPAGVVVSSPAQPAAAGEPGVATTMPDAAAPAAPELAPEIQVVRFQGPVGLSVEVLSPAPEPVPLGDGGGVLTVGLRRGVGYRLRVSKIPYRPDVEIFPVVEVVGHLHRPQGVDPGKYPIRVVFRQEDLDDVVDLGRLVTKVVYLEDPDQAIPLKVAKDQVSSLTLNPTEPPLRVASALGRPMAIVRIGGRRPAAEELSGESAGDAGLDYAAGIGAAPCPYLGMAGARCGMPRGPVCTTAPAPAKPILPRDEYLCDGGDRGVPASPGDHDTIGGIEPRDAVVRFDIGLRGQSKPRVLPTNVVCVYAPRFAEVRVPSAAIEAVDVQVSQTNKYLAKMDKLAGAVPPRRLVQNQAPELARDRSRASGLRGRLLVGESSNNRGLAAYAGGVLFAVNQQKQKPELTRDRAKATYHGTKARVQAIRTGETPLVTGIIEGASEAVKVWGPHSMTGLETPPDRPGLAVIKRVSAQEAEPGDTLTYVIVYRNMGNTPIAAVTIVDSLLPRLEYLKGTSEGPEGTTFTTALNRTGSTELRWTLKNPLPPGVMGHVSFQAVVR